MTILDREQDGNETMFEMIYRKNGVTDWLSNIERFRMFDIDFKEQINTGTSPKAGIIIKRHVLKKNGETDDHRSYYTWKKDV